MATWIAHLRIAEKLLISFPILDFLLPEGVRWEINHIQTYYRQRDQHALERLNRQRIYLTMPEMDAFVDTATSVIKDITSKLQTDLTGTSQYISALGIVPWQNE